MRQVKVFHTILWLLAALLLVACDQNSEGTTLGSETLYSDTFTAGEIGPWELEGDAGGYSAIENSALVISVTSPNTLQYATLDEPIFDNFTIEVDAAMQSGSAPDSYGILFRLQEIEGEAGGVSFYRFEVTGEATYILERRHPDGSWTRFTDGWQESGAIQVGLGATNRLQVLAGGGSINLYVNGTPLGQFNDPDPLLQGKIALDAGTFGPSNLRVSFDNLVVRAP
jgi:hypothetical protein